MLKQINPEDLVVGQEYYVKLKFDFKDTGLTPYCFRDILEDDYWYHKDQPIYTLDDQPNHPDPELVMLVNVASRLYATTNFGNYDTCALEAAYLIAACKNQLKQQG